MTELKKVFLLLPCIFLFIACGDDDNEDDNDDNGGGNSGRLEITLEDSKKWRIQKTVSYLYGGSDIGKQIDPGASGEGAIWDFSKLDLSKYALKMKIEADPKKVDFSTSLYKEYYLGATECYMTKVINTYPDNGTLGGLYNTYEYLEGNKDYGFVQESQVPGESQASVWTNNPPVSQPYPQYRGLKYSERTTMEDILLINGIQSSTYSFSHAFDIVIDGEGALIMPNGTKLTDVLRYKLTDTESEEVQYNYVSKKLGVCAHIYPAAISQPEKWGINFVDEWD